MKEIHEYEKDLSSIRSMMERSVKFISLSGLSGVLAGVYALLGATAAYFVSYYPDSPFEARLYIVNENQEDETSILLKLILIASLVLIASITTGIWLSHRKAKKYQIELWNATSQRLLMDLSIPLITGGLFILIMLAADYYGLVAPAMLIFYGLALIQASNHTYEEIRYLGFSEIAIGLIAALLPGFGLLFWALGFGVLHIIYGTVMYYRHDQ